MFQALYDNMGVEGCGSCPDWDTTFSSLSPDWITCSIKLQVAFFLGCYVTYSNLCNGSYFFCYYAINLINYKSTQVKLKKCVPKADHRCTRIVIRAIAEC